MPYLENSKLYDYVQKCVKTCPSENHYTRYSATLKTMTCSRCNSEYCKKCTNGVTCLECV